MENIKHIRSSLLLMFVLGVTGCSSDNAPPVELPEQVPEAETFSFSLLVRDIYSKSEDSAPLFAIEGEDYEYLESDDTETFSDLTAN